MNAKQPSCSFFRFAPMALVLCLVATLFAAQAFAATVPQAASAAGREMDRQIAGKAAGGRGISLAVTTPVNINDLTASNALARQMQEEVARFFVQAGYNVQEIRKTRDLLFEPGTGEMALTREDRLVGNRNVTSSAIVTGTYVVASDHVRFNIRVVRTKGRDVLAMSTVTLPMNREIASLVNSGGGGIYGGTPIEPTVVTLLP